LQSARTPQQKENSNFKPKRFHSARPLLMQQQSVKKHFLAETTGNCNVEDQIKIILQKIDQTSKSLLSPIKMTDMSKNNENGIEKHYCRDIYSINFEIRQIYQIKCEKMQKKSILKVFRAALRLIEIVAADCNSALRIRKPHIYSSLGRLIQNLSKVGNNFNITNDWNQNTVLNALEQALKNASVEEFGIKIQNSQYQYNAYRVSNCTIATKEKIRNKTKIPQSLLLQYIVNN
jgi:hypothetical protein